MKFFKKYSTILSVIMEVLESFASKQIAHLRSLFKIESAP